MVMSKKIKIDRDPALQKLTLKIVASNVAEHFTTTVQALRKTTRKKEIREPRQIIAYFALLFTPNTPAEIGKYLGGLDRTTILHSYYAVTKRMKESNAFASIIMELERVFRLNVKSLNDAILNPQMLRNILALNEQQQAKLQVMDREYERSRDQLDVIAELSQLGLTLDILHFYHGNMSLLQFETMIELPYDQAKFRIYAMQLIFNGSHPQVTETQLADTLYSGSTWSSWYRKAIETSF